MIFYLNRLFSNKEETVGVLSSEDGQRLCWIIEDEQRAVKVYGETRIPAGTYELTLRTFGTHHEKYKGKYDFHLGMIELKNVPSFTGILIHTGNSEKDTAGCLLTNKLASIEKGDRYKGAVSEVAYKYIYPMMANPLYAGERVFLKIIDELF